MKFQIGLPRCDVPFAIEDQGWSRHEETFSPDDFAKTVAIWGIGLSVLTYLASPQSADFVSVLNQFGLVLVLFIVTGVVHELLHGICHPGYGLRSNSIYGVLPKQGCLYAHWSGELTVLRYRVTLSMPFVVLTMGSMGLAFLVEQGPLCDLLAFIAVTNASMSGGDLYGLRTSYKDCRGYSEIAHFGTVTYLR